MQTKNHTDECAGTGGRQKKFWCDYITAVPLLVELLAALAMYLAVNYKKLDQAVVDAMSLEDLLPQLDCIKSGRVGI
jgi:hypothetical protein